MISLNEIIKKYAKIDNIDSLSEAETISVRLTGFDPIVEIDCLFDSLRTCKKLKSLAYNLIIAPVEEQDQPLDNMDDENESFDHTLYSTLYEPLNCLAKTLNYIGVSLEKLEINIEISNLNRDDPWDWLII
ncbi:MAG: hypothetical protein ACO1N3_03395 [Gammaproteobacteria bacterium]